MTTQNLKTILENLPVNVTLAAVSKFQPNSDIEKAYKAGQRVFAESRPLEMQNKFKMLPKDIQWQFIGHLQTNKIKNIIEFVDLIQSIDSEKLLIAVDNAAKKKNRVVKVLLQVFVAQEETKQGFSPEEIINLFKQKTLKQFANINVVGIMAMATLTENETLIENEFKNVKKLYDRINKEFDVNLSILSMGMSIDYKIAIQEGSNMVRIGSAIFGSR